MLLETLSKLKRSIIMFAIVLMFIGWMFALTPERYMPFIGSVVTGVLGVCSILSIFNFANSNKSLASCIKLAGGLFVGILAVALFAFDGLFVSSLYWAVVVVPIALGVLGIIGAFTTARRSGRRGWWVLAILSLLLVAFGDVMLLNPWMDDPQSVTRLIGGALMYSSIVCALSLIWIWPIKNTEEE